jgi:hypothetical protein
MTYETQQDLGEQLVNKTEPNPASSTDAAPKQKRPREYRKSGFYKRKRRVNLRGLDGMDARTVEGRDVLKFRDDSIDQLGGQDLSPTKKALLDVAVGERYLWRSGWAYIMQLGDKLVNKRKRAFPPVVKDTLLIGESLKKSLQTLGLERVARQVTLQALLDATDDPPANRQTAPEPWARLTMLNATARAKG